MSLRFAIAAGGTGGHVVPAVALARHMEAAGHSVVFLTDDRGARFADTEGLESYTLPAARYTGPRAAVPFAATFAASWRAARRRLAHQRPHGLIAFGGYAAAPAALAKPRRTKLVLHEQNTVLGRTNRALAKRADLLIRAFPKLERVPGGVDQAELGTPVRRSVIEAAREPYLQPEPEGTLRLLILGGSQGSTPVTQLSVEMLSALPEAIRRRMQVTLQTRSEDKETAEIALQAGGLSAEIATYFDDMPERMAASQLVIARAGASTLAELAAIGRPAILIPLSSSADNHQHKNAQVFADHHGAILAPESEATGERLARTMRALLEDPARLAAMAEAVKALAHPDASAAITQRLERLCHDG